MNIRELVLNLPNIDIIAIKMTSIIGEYNTNPAFFNSTKTFMNSTVRINKQMDKLYNKKDELDELFKNQNYIWINRLKINLTKGLTIEKASNGEYPRIRKLEATIDKDSLDYFNGLMQSLRFLEELIIHIDPDDKNRNMDPIDFLIFPKSLHSITVKNYGWSKFIIRHPYLETLDMMDCKDSIINIDECPRLLNFRIGCYCRNEFICTRERIFENFVIDSGPREPIHNENILVYDEKQKTFRPAFDVDNENDLYDENDLPFTFKTNKWVSLRTTTKIDSEFYKKRPGIEMIDFREEIPIDVDPNPRIHDAITNIQCHPIHLESLIYFENLKHICLYDFSGEEGNYQILFEKNPNVDIFFLGNRCIDYDECFEKYADRISFAAGIPELHTEEYNIHSCLRFADIMKFDNFIITGPVDYLGRIDSTKFHYMRHDRITYFTRKPYPYLYITGHDTNPTCSSDRNCDFLVVDDTDCNNCNMKSFKKVILINCYVGNIVCPRDLEIHNCCHIGIIDIKNSKNKRLYMTNDSEEQTVRIRASPDDCENKFAKNYKIVFEK